MKRAFAAAVLLAGLAQSLTTAADGERELPRRPDGQPDLSGVWQVMNNAHYNIEAQPAQPALALRSGPFGPVPAPEVVALGAVGAVPATSGVVEGGELPYRDWALEERAENRERWLERDPEIKCYLPGIPRANYMPYPFQILHSDTQVTFVYEYRGVVRNIRLEDPRPPPVDAWMGHSYGRWEGDTFVVEVNGFLGRTWFDRAGNFHSNSLEVTERYTPTSPYTMRYEALIEDPEVFTEPWSMRMTLYRRVGEDAELQPFNCIPFVEELLYGDLRREPLEAADDAER